MPILILWTISDTLFAEMISCSVTKYAVKQTKS